MKKIFLTLIAMLSISIASFANDVKNVNFEIVHGSNAETIENVTPRFFNGEACAYITFIFDKDSKLNFTAYDVVEKNGKIYIYGKGDQGMNMICIEGNKVHMPFYSNRKFVFDNAAIANKILEIVGMC